MQTVAILINIGLFVIGLLMLVYGSNYLIDTATRVAKKYGVSDLLIGLTIVAIGTSLPEVVASIVAILAGKGDLALGNIAGSSLTNLTLVVGVAAIAAPLATNHIILERDTKIMIFVFLLFGVMVFDPITPGLIVFWESMILVLIMIAYLSFLFWGKEECDTCYQFTVFVDFFVKGRFITTLQKRETATSSSSSSSQSVTTQITKTEDDESLEDSRGENLKSALIIIVSAIAVALGAQLVVTQTEFISSILGIDESIVAFTMIALGTSLPELTVSINSARLGFGRMLIGNVVGSNIINLTLGLGLMPLVIPTAITMLTAGVLLSMMLVVSLIFFYFIRKDWRVTRIEGIALLVIYLIVIGFLITLSQLGLI